MARRRATVVDDSIIYNKLGVEFKDADALAAFDIDWDIAAVFSKTVVADPTFTFSNLTVTTKVLEVIGDWSPIFPTGFIYTGGVRAAVGTTLYLITCTDVATPTGFYTILKAE
jgi:hypothetical protein